MFSIVIPAYNEGGAIADTLNRCKKIIEQIGNIDSEIIVVDDGSEDTTAEVAVSLGAIVVNHPHNIGYGRSLKDGISCAKNDMIIITDADGTYPIEEIPELIAYYKKGFDMVVGARKGKHYKQSVLKSFSRRILRFLVEYTAGRKIEDINSGLRIFSKKTSLNYFDRLCDTFSFTTSLTLAYMMTGKFVKYTPISYEKRVGKTKVKHFRDSLRTLQYIVEAIIYYNPIKLFILFSLILILTGFLSLVIAYFSLLSIFYFLGIGCFLMSVLMFGLGLIVVLLKQAMNNNVANHVK